MEKIAAILVVIGGSVVLLLAWSVIQEIARAIYTSHRIATVISRMDGRRNTSLRRWYQCFKSDLYSTYDELSIGKYTLDHDPRKPARRRD